LLCEGQGREVPYVYSARACHGQVVAEPRGPEAFERAREAFEVRLVELFGRPDRELQSVADDGHVGGQVRRASTLGLGEATLGDELDEVNLARVTYDDLAGLRAVVDANPESLGHERVH